MQKTLAWLAVILVAAMIFISVYFAKDAYEILPGMPPKPLANEHMEAEGWYEFKAPEKFKLLFPTMPQHASESIIDPKTKELKKYDMYVSEKGTGSIFMLTTITFPENKKFDNADDILKNMVNDMVNVNPKNKLENMKEGTFKNMKSVDFSIVNDDVHLQGKEFINGQTLYVLAAMEKKQSYSEKEVQHFFESFDILRQPSLSGNTPFPLQN